MYRYTYNGLKTEPPVCFLKLPPAAEQTWKTDSTVSGERVQADFKVDQEKATVPAGEFDAFVVISDIDTPMLKMASSIWYAKDTGMVKQVMKIGPREFLVELTKFTRGTGQAE